MLVYALRVVFNEIPEASLAQPPDWKSYMQPLIVFEIGVEVFNFGGKYTP